MSVPKKNTAFTFNVNLVDQSARPSFKANPTLATGDVKVSIDGAAFGNITTLPVVTPSGGRTVAVALSASEMNGDRIDVQFVDAAGAEWDDVTISIYPTVRTVDDILPTSSYVAQTGDSYAVVASGTYGNAATKTLLDTIAGYVDTEVAAIKAKTDNLPAAPAAVADIAALFTTAMTESYNADGSAPTPAQALFGILQRLTEFSISGTTITVHKLNGSTPAMTLTIDSATSPTSSTRAT